MGRGRAEKSLHFHLMGLDSLLASLGKKTKIKRGWWNNSGGDSYLLLNMFTYRDLYIHKKEKFRRIFHKEKKISINLLPPSCLDVRGKATYLISESG